MHSVSRLRSTVSRLRSTVSRVLARSATLFWGTSLGLVVAQPVAAQVAPAFSSKLVVDANYITGANSATDVAFAADGRAVVTQKLGTILVRRTNGTLNSVPYPFGGTLDTNSEKGLLGVVADPNVATNNAFYFYVSNGPTGDKHRVYRAVLTSNDSFLLDPTPIIAASRNLGPGLEGPANHAGGGLAIHNGRLYVGVGDSGANSSPPVNKYGSCLNKGNGKILRVNLDGSVPNDNPLVGLSSVTACNSPTGPWTTAPPDPRVFAWGFRNPWRFWIDPHTGLLWIGDVGELTAEEISVGSGNTHYGYPFEEGNRVWGNVDGLNCSSLNPSRPCTAPVHAYPRSNGTAVTGGLIPEGCGWSNVFNGPHYLFGDSGAGWMYALSVNGSRTGVTSAPISFADFGAIVSLRMGPDASLYAVFFDLGRVYRFTPIDRSGVDCASTAVPSSSRFSNGLLLAMIATFGAGLYSVAKKRELSRV